MRCTLWPLRQPHLFLTGPVGTTIVVLMVILVMEQPKATSSVHSAALWHFLPCPPSPKPPPLPPPGSLLPFFSYCIVNPVFSLLEASSNMPLDVFSLLPCLPPGSLHLAWLLFLLPNGLGPVLLLSSFSTMKFTFRRESHHSWCFFTFCEYS